MKNLVMDDFISSIRVSNETGSDCIFIRHPHYGYLFVLFCSVSKSFMIFSMLIGLGRAYWERTRTVLLSLA